VHEDDRAEAEQDEKEVEGGSEHGVERHDIGIAGPNPSGVPASGGLEASRPGVLRWAAVRGSVAGSHST